MISYNKLVRDRIPELIRASGKECEVAVLDNEGYAVHLEAKLREELEEFLGSRDVAELADLVEVVYAIVQHSGVSREDFEEVRLSKREHNGGFDGRLLLVSVED